MKFAKFFILTICLTFTIACKNTTKDTTADENKPKDEVVSQNLQDTISKSRFDDWTNRWDSLGAMYSDTSLVKYYSFPTMDMSEFLMVFPSKAYFYQGLEKIGNGKYKAHLILTGDDAQGNSINLYYDVSNPCPPNCPK